jgi:hypothetical protein
LFPVAWRDFLVGEATWEPYSVMAVNVSEMKKFVGYHDDQNMVSKMRYIWEFSWGSVTAEVSSFD